MNPTKTPVASTNLALVRVVDFVCFFVVCLSLIDLLSSQVGFPNCDGSAAKACFSLSGNKTRHATTNNNNEYNSGDAFSVEHVRDAFPTIEDFSGATHPNTPNDAFAPIMQNLENAKCVLFVCVGLCFGFVDILALFVVCVCLRVFIIRIAGGGEAAPKKEAKSEKKGGKAKGGKGEKAAKNTGPRLETHLRCAPQRIVCCH